MATQTLTPPGICRGVTDSAHPVTSQPATITLPIGDRRQIELAIDALIDILDEHDRRPSFEITPAGHQALAEARP